MSKTRSFVAIDAANIVSGFRAIKETLKLEPNTRLDYEKLVGAVTLGAELVSKTVYVESRSASPDDYKHRTFLDFFKYNGYKVVTKEVKYFIQSDGTRKGKANFDVEIATDICRQAWRRDCDEVVLVSGDSDFAYLVDMVKELNIRVTVVSTKGTVSEELAERADRLILLDNLDPKTFTFTKEMNIS